MTFPMKNNFGQFSSLPPLPTPPPENRKFYFYCRLAFSDLGLYMSFWGERPDDHLRGNICDSHSQYASTSQRPLQVMTEGASRPHMQPYQSGVQIQTYVSILSAGFAEMKKDEKNQNS